MLPSPVEQKLRQKGKEWIAGVDEAGRGPWAGPVVAAAVWLPEKMHNRAGQSEFLKINDSKKINEKVRLTLFDLICEEGKFGLGIQSAYWIDKLNILGATFRAMQEAVEKLASKLDKDLDYLLIDGNFKIPNSEKKQKAIIKGDASERLIAAASVVAKVTRDHLMFQYDQKYPQYGFASHKGYGTMKHRKTLTQYGLCPIHRKTFLVKNKNNY